MRHKKDAHDAGKHRTQHSAGSRTVKDPVCGMDVEPESASGRHEHGGQTYYFCNPLCLEKFRAEPRKYLAQPGDTAVEEAPRVEETAQPVGRENVYTCPMDPEIQEQRPGPCPKCGMALEPLTGAAPVTKTEYVCPMHPEIARAEPGSCPICGMALEARIATLEE